MLRSTFTLLATLAILAVGRAQTPGYRSCEPSINGVIGVATEGRPGGIQVGYERNVKDPEVCRANCMNNEICTEWMYYKGCSSPSRCNECTYYFLGEIQLEPDNENVLWGGTCTGTYFAGPGNGSCTQDSCPFSYENYAVDGGSRRLGAADRCGEVDAAKRMPASIWKDQNAVNNYVAATLEWYNVNGFKLKQSPCDRADRKQNGSSFASWTMPNLMKNVCDAKCGCVYPACPDVPDDPQNHRYCSLCGPLARFNRPIEVQFWDCFAAPNSGWGCD